MWHRFIKTGTQPLCLSFIYYYSYMLPDSSPEAFSLCHSPDKVSYLPTGNRIFSLHYDNPEACVCSASTVPTLPCRSSSVHRPARDGFQLSCSQSGTTRKLPNDYLRKKSMGKYFYCIYLFHI